MTIGAGRKSEVEHLPKYSDKKFSNKSKPVDYSVSEATDVWYGRNLWRYSSGPVGLITHRKCFLELDRGGLSLKRGSSVIFSSPINKVKIQNVTRNFGGLKLSIGTRTYTILFYRPFYHIRSDLNVNKTTKWQQLLLNTGASEV